MGAVSDTSTSGMNDCAKADVCGPSSTFHDDGMSTLTIGKLDAQVVQLLHEPVEERGILALRIPYNGRVAKVLQVSRRHQTIAALVAWATRHQDALAIRLRRVAPVHGFGTG